MGSCCGFAAETGGGTITNPTSIPTWFPCLNFDYTDFNGTAALVKSNNLFSLLPSMTIEAIVIKTSIAFVGAGITSLDMSVGIAGDLARYCSRYNVLAAVTGINFGSGDLFFLEDFVGATQVLLSAVAVGANLTALTAGHGCVWVKGSLLPAP